jgi:hypothetical protein
MTMLAALVFAVVGSSANVVSVAPVTLDELVMMSDAIVIGEVERVVDVKPTFGAWFVPDELASSTWPIAELRVLRTLKGDPNVVKRRFAAFKTWMCDTSDAKVGERALYFLADMDPASELGEELVPEIKDEFGAPEAAWIVHSGRGSMAISTVDGREYVTCWVSDVEVPEPLPRIASIEGYDFISRLELAPLVDEVRARIAAQRAVCIEAEVLRAPGVEPWKLSVRGDRTATLTVGDSGAVAREWKLETRGFLTLRRRLDHVRSLKDGVVFGGPSTASGERALRLLDRAESVTIVLRDLDPLQAYKWRRADGLGDALEIWAPLRGHLDDPDLADHRANDAQVLTALP